MEYPAQIDMVWLATDETGAVAAMITAGEGPVPASVLANDADDVLGIEEALLRLPRVAEATMHGQMGGDLSDFIALSERGLFAYDWSDIHRTKAESLGAYELIAAPSALLHFAELPQTLRVLTTPIKGYVFGQRLLQVR